MFAQTFLNFFYNYFSRKMGLKFGKEIEWEGNEILKSTEKDGKKIGGLFLSARPHEEELLHHFHSKNIKNILDVTNHHQIKHLIHKTNPHKITYKGVPMDDVGYFKIIEKFDECFEYINNGRAKGESVLVHCEAGISRSASVVIAYLYSINFKEKLFDCYLHVKKERSKIRPNFGFIMQLSSFESQSSPNLNYYNNNKINDNVSNNSNDNNDKNIVADNDEIMNENENNNNNMKIINEKKEVEIKIDQEIEKNHFLIHCIRDYYNFDASIADETILTYLIKYQFDIYKVINDLVPLNNRKNIIY